VKIGFKEARKRVIAALLHKRYSHETRTGADEKNLLLAGAVAPEDLAGVISLCCGQHHQASPHHWR